MPLNIFLVLIQILKITLNFRASSKNKNFVNTPKMELLTCDGPLNRKILEK